MRKEDHFDRPPGPLGGLWSLWYLDPIKVIQREMAGFRKVRHQVFADLLKPGDDAPPVKLKTTEGREVDFADFRGKKNIVLEFGAIT
ncbi:MAG: hypothetical protein V3U53_03885 [bacterium]